MRNMMPVHAGLAKQLGAAATRMRLKTCGWRVVGDVYEYEEACRLVLELLQRVQVSGSDLCHITSLAWEMFDYHLCGSPWMVLRVIRGSFCSRSTEPKMSRMASSNHLVSSAKPASFAAA